MGPFLRWGNWAVAKLIEVLYNSVYLSDVGCTFRVLTREAIDRISPEFEGEASSFGLEMMLHVTAARLRFVQVPVRYLPRVGESAVTGHLGKTIQLGTEMILMTLRHRLKTWRSPGGGRGASISASPPTSRPPRVAAGRSAVKLFVTGGAGFIGSNYVHHVLATTDDEVTVFDALTYAGNLENLKDLEGDPRLTFVHGQHLRPRGRRRRAAGPRRGRALRGREPRRPVAARPRRVRPHQLRRHQRAVRPGQPDRRGALPAHLHRRGVRLDRGRELQRVRSAAAPLAVLGGQGRHRPDRDGVPRDVRAARWSSPGRRTSSGRTSSPRSSSRSSSRRCSRAAGCRCTATGSTSATGCSSRTTAAASTWCCAQGTVGEVYNVGAGNERTNREITDTILAALGKDESSVEYVEDRKGHDRRYSIAVTRPPTSAGRPQHTFEDAIEATIRWYLDHEWWWKPLRARVKNR